MPTGSNSGLSHIVGLTGNHFDLRPVAGQNYLYLAHGNLRVTGSSKPHAKADATYLDSVSITTGDHSVSVTFDKILIDCKPPLDSHQAPGNWAWVDGMSIHVGADGWLVTVVQDDGTGTPHKGGALENVPHVSLFAYPPVPSQAKGILAEGYHGLDPARFEV